MKNVLIVLLSIFILVSIVPAQEGIVGYTPADKRFDAWQQRLKLNENSIFREVEFSSIGPSVMSGRVTDIEVNPADPAVFYVAYASGGLWKTTNNGVSFSPLFDNEATITIGDIAVDWDNNIIYVGTGENNSSRSSYAGTGIYSSPDDGENWNYLGLAETHHTGRIIIDKKDPKRIYVAALGHLYTANNERGIYVSDDGGATWNKKLFVDENTGAIDLIADPANPDILYASMWHRKRRAWDFTESGKTSGIYKSTDRGENWFHISGSESGFPQGVGNGRIGLDIFPGNTNVIYAFLDNQALREKQKEEEYAFTKQMITGISSSDFLELENKDLEDFLRRNSFPKKYSAEFVKKEIEAGKIKPQALIDYLGDANNFLFDTPVKGGEIYLSEDGGKSWKRTHDEYIDDFVFSYGYYFGEIRVSPFNRNKIYVLGVPLLISEDGGKSFSSIMQDNVHADFQALWVSSLKDGHLITGNDGGINISWDDGKTWIKANTPPVGQFYTVNIDLDTPFNVYGGLQDNGVWKGPSNYKASTSWHQTGHYLYKSVMGGDGMQVAVDTRDNNTIYTGYQFGNYYRINVDKEKYKFIAPKHELGEKPFRFNWQTPIHLSVHNQDILYLGSNKLHRSMDKGDNFEVISGDLTNGGKKGDVPYGTLTTISESPLKFGLIYTGSDDGKVYVTKGGGNEWEDISAGLPQGYWISRVIASAFDINTVYVSLNGYRDDYFEAMIYRSSDCGKQWEKIGGNLPAEPVNVIREDVKKKNILYAGTDHGLYISINGGETFSFLGKGMPAVPVHDMVLHPQENKLVAATHGRSLYIADISHIRMLDEKIMAEELYLFSPGEIKYNNQWGMREWKWSEPILPEKEIVFWSAEEKKINLIVSDEKNNKIFEDDTDAVSGLNYYSYNLKDNSDKDEKTVFLKPGKYTARISDGEITVSEEFEIVTENQGVK